MIQFGKGQSKAEGRRMAQRQRGVAGGLRGHGGSPDIYDVAAEYQPDILRPLQPKVTSQDVLSYFRGAAAFVVYCSTRKKGLY